MVDSVFSEIIHKLSRFDIVELQEVKRIWMQELKKNNVSERIQIACEAICDEISAYKQNNVTV